MSGVKVDTISNVAGTQSVDTGDLIDKACCMAWVNYDGSAVSGTSSDAIRDAFNVDTITDIATGKHTINFTNALPNVNYAVVCGGGRSLTGPVTDGIVGFYNATTSSVTIEASNGAGAFEDFPAICIAIFGN